MEISQQAIQNALKPIYIDMNELADAARQNAVYPNALDIWQMGYEGRKIIVQYPMLYGNVQRFMNITLDCGFYVGDINKKAFYIQISMITESEQHSQSIAISIGEDNKLTLEFQIEN